MTTKKRLTHLVDIQPQFMILVPMKLQFRLVPATLVLLVYVAPGFARDYVEKSWRHKSGNIHLGTVYFEYGSHHLNSSGREQIREISSRISRYFPDMSQWKYNPAVDQINYAANLQITGYADNDGNNEYNLNLGLLRAEEVAQALENTGINLENARVASYGETKSSGNASRFRRVDIWLRDGDSRDSDMPVYLILTILGAAVLIGMFFILTSRTRKTRYWM